MVAYPKHVEVGHIDNLGIFNITFACLPVILFYAVCN